MFSEASLLLWKMCLMCARSRDCSRRQRSNTGWYPMLQLRVGQAGLQGAVLSRRNTSPVGSSSAARDVPRCPWKACHDRHLAGPSVVSAGGAAGRLPSHRPFSWLVPAPKPEACLDIYDTHSPACYRKRKHNKMYSAMEMFLPCSETGTTRTC